MMCNTHVLHRVVDTLDAHYRALRVPRKDRCVELQVDTERNRCVLGGRLFSVSLPLSAQLREALQENGFPRERLSTLKQLPHSTVQYFCESPTGSMYAINGRELRRALKAIVNVVGDYAEYPYNHIWCCGRPPDLMLVAVAPRGILFWRLPCELPAAFRVHFVTARILGATLTDENTSLCCVGNMLCVQCGNVLCCHHTYPYVDVPYIEKLPTQRNIVNRLSAQEFRLLDAARMNDILPDNTVSLDMTMRLLSYLDRQAEVTISNDPNMVIIQTTREGVINMGLYLWKVVY